MIYELFISGIFISNNKNVWQVTTGSTKQIFLAIQPSTLLNVCRPKEFED